MQASSPCSAQQAVSALLFDTYERFRLIESAIGLCNVSRDHWILDVGGQPGTLARLLADRRVVTVDLVPAGHKPYARASGMALPFRDGTFACTTCSDVLEHVPQTLHAAFLDEMWRVSSDFILIGGPFNTAGVIHAENRIRHLETSSPTQTTFWLNEHAVQPLPSLDAIWSYFEARGAACAAIPSGDLMRWFVLFATSSLLEGIPFAGEAFRAFMPDYNEHFSTTITTQVAYRHLLVVARNGRLPAGLESIPHLKSKSEIPQDDPGVVQRIDAAWRLFQGIAHALSEHLEKCSSGKASPEAAYVDQLERALSDHEKRLRELEQQLASQSLAPRTLIRRVIQKLLR